MWVHGRALQRAGSVWTLSTLTGIVGRRTYFGEAFSGDMVDREAHPAPVSRAEWEAAQARPTPRARGGEGSLLTGIARCRSCGGTLTPGRDSAGTDATTAKPCVRTCTDKQAKVCEDTVGVGSPS